MNRAIVVFNAGSTSLKFAAYAVDAGGALSVLCVGRIDSMQGDPHFVVKNASGKPWDAHEWGEGHAIDHRTALSFIIAWLEANLVDTKVVAAGHRVVLGGTRFDAPVRIEGDVLDYLDSLAAMEPSHQPFNVRGSAGDRCSSRWRRQHVCHAGRKERGDHDGFRRRVWPANGDALG
jgi:acetate kinase